MTLSELNKLPQNQLKGELQKCCGSSAWIEKMVSAFPFTTTEEMISASEEIWWSLSGADWKEAFAHHPKIGDVKGPLLSGGNLGVGSDKWAAGEQSAVQRTTDAVLNELAEFNKKYEERFGYIFIVCATGKSAEEMLSLLKQRLNNQPGEEIKIAAAEQNKITQLRLQKLLNQ